MLLRLSIANKFVLLSAVKHSIRFPEWRLREENYIFNVYPKQTQRTHFFCLLFLVTIVEDNHEHRWKSIVGANNKVKATAAWAGWNYIIHMSLCWDEITDSLILIGDAMHCASTKYHRESHGFRDDYKIGMSVPCNFWRNFSKLKLLIKPLRSNILIAALAGER